MLLLEKNPETGKIELPEELPNLLNQEVTLAPDITLGDICRLIKPYSEFLTPLTTLYLDEFLEEAQKPNIELAEPDGEPPIDHLKIKRYIELEEDSEANETLYINGIAYGVVDKETYRYRIARYDMEQAEELTYSLSFQPMNKLAHLPIVLDTEVTITKNIGLYYKVLMKASSLDIEDVIQPQGNRFTRFLWSQVLRFIPKSRNLLTFRKDFTLQEILYTIFWEISWFGPPADRDEQKKELLDRVEDYQED